MPYGSVLHTPTNYHLLAAQKELFSFSFFPFLKPIFYQKMLEKFLGKSQENGPWAEKLQDRKSKRTRQRNKRGDRKGQSKDSPEIPGRRETSDIPSLPSGLFGDFLLSGFCHSKPTCHTGRAPGTYPCPSCSPQISCAHQGTLPPHWCLFIQRIQTMRISPCFGLMTEIKQSM